MLFRLYLCFETLNCEKLQTFTISKRKISKFSKSLEKCQNWIRFRLYVSFNTYPKMCEHFKLFGEFMDIKYMSFSFLELNFQNNRV